MKEHRHSVQVESWNNTFKLTDIPIEDEDNEEI